MSAPPPLNKSPKLGLLAQVSAVQRSDRISAHPALALQIQLTDILAILMVSELLVGRFRQSNFIRAARLLHPRCDIHRVAP